MAEEYDETDKRLMESISAHLKADDVKGAVAQIRTLVQNSTNADVVREYASLLNRLVTMPKTSPAQKNEQQFEIQVEHPTTTFRDVKGMNRLKKKLSKEVILMIRNRRGYLKHRLKPSGILLYGPPGVGKTFLAESLAGEFGMSIIKPDLARIFSQWVGETEKNIEKMVTLAKLNEPCVIFIDEVDAKIRNRANIEARGESAVNLGATTQFLETMQRVHNENNQILFVAGSNRIWDVDAAAKRPGRFGDLIYVPPPKIMDRLTLFTNYLRTVDEKKISFAGYLRLALATAGYSPADIEEICIIAKKEMLYKNVTDNMAYFDKKFTREDYLAARAAGQLPAKPKEMLSTGSVVRVIRKQFKTSSLDMWYVESQKALVGWDETVVEKQKGLIRTKTFKKKVKHEGRMTKDEQKIYKAMFLDIKKANRRYRRMWVWFLRQFGRWI